MATMSPAPTTDAAYASRVDEVAAALHVDPEVGLSDDEVPDSPGEGGRRGLSSLGHPAAEPDDERLTR